MSASGFAKRVRVAILKRLPGRKQSESVVFQFVGSKEVEAVSFIQLEKVTPAHFSTWRTGAIDIEAINLACARGDECYAICSSSGVVLCMLLIRQGDRFASWYIELSDEDMVIYGVNTHKVARGQRLAARLSSGVATQMRKQGKRVLLDCKTWNVSARRSFEAAGFAKYRDEPFAPILEGEGPKSTDR